MSPHQSHQQNDAYQTGELSASGRAHGGYCRLILWLLVVSMLAVPAGGALTLWLVSTSLSNYDKVYVVSGFMCVVTVINLALVFHYLDWWRARSLMGVAYVILFIVTAVCIVCVLTVVVLRHI